MKKLSALVLALAMAISLTACGDGGKGNTSGSNPVSSNPGEFKPSNKTVTLIVPYAAGGAVDLGARLMAKYAANYTDIDIVINNVTGGSGTVGAAEMLKYNADGTYMLAYNPSPSNVPTADKPLTYDCTTDTAMVSMMVRDERLITVRADDSRFQTLEEFIEYTKSNPVNLGCSGTGNAAYFTPLMLAEAAGITDNMTVVAFDGSAEAKTALLGSHIEAASQSYSDIAAAPEQFTVLCTAGSERFSKLPDVPTMQECGYDVEMYVSRGFAMKAGTDPQIVEYWSNLIAEVSANEDYQKDLANIGCPVANMDKDEYATLVSETFQTIREILG